MQETEANSQRSVRLVKVLIIAGLALPNLLHHVTYNNTGMKTVLGSYMINDGERERGAPAEMADAETASNLSSTVVLPPVQAPAIADSVMESAASIIHDDLPGWFQEYMTWHADARSRLNETNWQNYDYLLLRCVKGEICEGASDRLKHVPTMLLLAAQALPKRLFFIHWSKPCALEEFLVPPKGGLNWSLPSFLVDKIQANERIGPLLRVKGPDVRANWLQNKRKIVRLIKMFYAEGMFEALRDPVKDPDFWTGYGPIWNAVFAPSPGVQAAIDKVQHDLHIQPGHYHAVHVRAQYTSDKVDAHQERNALQCLLRLPNTTDHHTPIFIAADATQAVRDAIAYGKTQNLPVVGRENATEPLHLDKGAVFLKRSEDWENHSPSEFYDTFVDLYMLSGATCFAHGVGGYGRWASLIGASQTCSVDHHKKRC